MKNERDIIDEINSLLLKLYQIILKTIVKPETIWKFALEIILIFVFYLKDFPPMIFQVTDSPVRKLGFKLDLLKCIFVYPNIKTF